MTCIDVLKLGFFQCHFTVFRETFIAQSLRFARVFVAVLVSSGPLAVLRLALPSLLLLGFVAGSRGVAAVHAEVVEGVVTGRRVGASAGAVVAVLVPEAGLDELGRLGLG